MASPEGYYPCSLFYPPICTLFDFWQGLNFTTFYSLYQQLNPSNPPSLHYVQQHWIVLVNELFPDTTPSECMNNPIVNPVGQELKFEAFAFTESGGRVEADNSVVEEGERYDLKRRYESETRIDRVRETSEIDTVGLEAESDAYNAEGRHSHAEAGCRVGVEASCLGESKLLNGLATSKASTENGEEIPVKENDGSPVSDVQGRGCTKRRYRGKRAEKSKRESTFRELSDSIFGLALGVARASNGQAGQNELRNGVLSIETQQSNARVSDKMSSTFGGRYESDVADPSFASVPQCVDPCSLSHLELDAAINDLLRSVQYEMDAVHTDRLRLLNQAGWTRESATPRGRRS